MSLPAPPSSVLPKAASRRRGAWLPPAAVALLASAAVAGPSPGTDARAAETPSRIPVLVELFTSEGCSSCPPADALLARLSAEQPIPGAEVIALGLHVDYWDRLGWKDPFSSPLFSARQRSHAARFRSSRIYTPQLVVDGEVELVGSDERRARGAIAEAARRTKPPVAISAGSRRGGRLAVTIRLESLPASARRASLLVALVDDARTTEVPRGENAGRTLSHAAVARSLTEVGRLRPGAPFTWEGDLPDASGAGSVVAFVEETESGRVVAVGRARLAPRPASPPP